MSTEATAGYGAGSARRESQVLKPRKHATAGKAVDHTEKLPLELRTKIASMLPAGDLRQLRSSNKRWMKTVNAMQLTKIPKTIKDLWSNPLKWKRRREFEHSIIWFKSHYDTRWTDGSGDMFFMADPTLPFPYYNQPGWLMKDYNQNPMLALETHYRKPPFQITYTIIAGRSHLPWVHAVELFRREGPGKYDMKCRACELCEHNGETIKSIDSIFYDYRFGGSTRKTTKYDASGIMGDSTPVVRKLVESMFVHGNDIFDLSLIHI